MADVRFRPEPLRVVTFKAQQSLVELMNRASRRLGLSRSELIREAVYWYMLYYAPEILSEEFAEANVEGDLIVR